jgi:hypothetical protein
MSQLSGSDAMTSYDTQAAKVDGAVRGAARPPVQSSCIGRLVADILPGADAYANWSAVRALYHQHIQVLDGEHVPDVVWEALAGAVMQVSWSYTGQEEQMCEHALAILAEVAEHEILDIHGVHALYHDDRASQAPRTGAVRRRPAPGEAIVETCRRLRDVHHLRDALHSTHSSGLLIGSTSYGRFFNVRGNRPGAPASDLDFVIVAETSEILDTIGDRLAALPFASASDIDKFRHRSAIFAGSLDDGRTVFSHKIGLWSAETSDPMLPPGVASADYLLSLHVMTAPVLDRILVASTPRLRRETAGSRRTVKDYREAPRGQNDHVRTFAGRSYQLDLDSTPVDHGYLRLPRVYYIDPFDSYCPGFYQTMFLPRPDLPWDHLNVRPALMEFRAKLEERIQYETGRRPHAMLRLSLAHVRREAFAPHVTRSLDGGC